MTRSAKEGRADAPPTDFPQVCPKGHDVRWVRTSAVMKRANPFKGCWPELDARMTVAEVVTELEAGRAHLHAEFSPWWGLPSLNPGAAVAFQTEMRKKHAQKIAWFALNGFQHPLEVDVGVPSLGCHVAYPVQDGNHRLAAGIVRRELLGEDPWLPLSVGGDVEYAQRLGLW